MAMQKLLASRLVPTMPLYLEMYMIKKARLVKYARIIQQRSFYVLEQLHVLPNVTYLAKVRNTDEIIEAEGHHAWQKA